MTFLVNEKLFDFDVEHFYKEWAFYLDCKKIFVVMTKKSKLIKRNILRQPNVYFFVETT